jgi:hypothetical protein
MTATRLFFTLICCAAVAASAHAQTAPAADANVPKHACTKPGDVPGSLASDTQRKAWQKDYATYSDCLKKFISDQRAIAEPHNKASNAAIDEYNASAKYFNDQIEKLKDAVK